MQLLRKLIYVALFALATLSCGGQAFTINDPAFVQQAPPANGSSFSPTNLSGCKVFLEADLITGLSDGASVNTWPDFSGNGNNAVQYKFLGTLQTTPLYKVNIQNGQPAILFNGSSSMLSNSYTITSASTIIAVAIKTSGSGEQVIIDTELPLAPLLNVVEASRTTDHWGTYMNSVKETSFNDNTWRVMTCCSDGLTSNPSTSLCYTDLNAAETFTDTTRYGGDAFTRMGIGSDDGGASLSGYFNGYMFSIVIYNRQLSSTEVTQVVNYFKTKLSI